MTSHQSEGKENECQSLYKKFENVSELKRTQKYSVRFVNYHKLVGGVKYRLRFFYKESNESEVPTYLLYKEDQNGDEHIVESTGYKKGKKYQFIENSDGETTYNEEGINLGLNQDLFVHYINNKLEMLQGNFSDAQSSQKKFIDCNF
jgi:hypothetical protein